MNIKLTKYKINKLHKEGFDECDYRYIIRRAKEKYGYYGIYKS